MVDVAPADPRATTEPPQSESSPTAVLGTSATPHFPALDGARAVAALGVFVTHLGLLSGLITNHPALGPYLARLDVGVAVFFVLSGFLLYRPFVAAHFAAAPGPRLESYARRRLLRIFPAYWVALVLIAFVLRAPAFEEPHSFVAHLLLLHAYDGTQVTGGPIQQSWTLTIEIAFYAFVPCWAWLLGRHKRTRAGQVRVELVGLALLALASWGGNVILLLVGVKGSTFSQLGIWLPFRLTDFVPGMLLAVLSAWFAENPTSAPHWLRSGAFTSACWLAGVFAFWFLATQLHLPMFPTYSARQAFAVRVFYLLVAVLFLTPAVLGRGSGGVIGAVLANRTMVWLGLVSYGIYIWHEAWMILYQRWFHEPFLQAGFLRMGAFSAAATLATAALSWYLIERPAMAWGRRPPNPAG